jgi:predicted protein tyrosine phosphatase
MTHPKKLLFVCSQNQWRSPTAEKIFDGVSGYSAKSAGTEKGARIKVTEGLIGWADLIFVMERRHAERLRNNFGPSLAHKKIICLDIPDDLTYMHPELIELLKDRLSEHVELPD